MVTNRSYHGNGNNGKMSQILSIIVIFCDQATTCPNKWIPSRWNCSPLSVTTFHGKTDSLSVVSPPNSVAFSVILSGCMTVELNRKR